MTLRLYYHDGALLDFDATIVAHADGDPRRVILDRSAFYPTSGGQAHDLGTLNGVAVTDVSDAGDVFLHHLAAPLPLGPVVGRIEPLRRRDHMQQHTAQHLLSALAADRFGWRTVSVHFGPESSTIEVDSVQVGAEAVRTLETMANAAVEAALAVEITFESADEAIARGLRAAPSRAGEIRVITIAGLDRSACGGTHVSSTSAIGPIRLLGTERVRGHTRIAFLAGDRTLRRLAELDSTLQDLATALGCAPAEVAALVPRRLEELREARERLTRLEAERITSELARLAAATPRSADGVLRIVTEDRPDLLRAMALQVGAMDRALFAGTGAGDGATGVVIGTSADSGLDAGALLRQLLAGTGGKGGGSPRMAQGNVPAAAGLRDALLRTIGAADTP